MEIISDFIIIHLKYNYKDEVCTMIIGLRIVTISKEKYISIKVYLSFYKEEIVEVYI